MTGYTDVYTPFKCRAIKRNARGDVEIPTVTAPATRIREPTRTSYAGKNPIGINMRHFSHSLNPRTQSMCDSETTSMTAALEGLARIGESI